MAAKARRVAQGPAAPALNSTPPDPHPRFQRVSRPRRGWVSWSWASAPRRPGHGSLPSCGDPRPTRPAPSGPGRRPRQEGRGMTGYLGDSGLTPRAPLSVLRGFARPFQISASRSFESPKRSRCTPALSISDRYRLHILRFGLSEVVEHAAGLDLAAAAAEHHHRQLVVVVVAGHHARAEQDHRVVEQRPLAFLHRVELAGDVGQLLR